MPTKTISVRGIDIDEWKEFKIQSIQKDIPVHKRLNELIKQANRKTAKKGD